MFDLCFVATIRLFQFCRIYRACKMEKSELYPDLEWIENQFTYKQLFDLLYLLAQFRYATFKQLHSINHRVARKGYLVKLSELGYLNIIQPVKNQKAFHITEKTKNILKREGYNTRILQEDFTGKELIHDLKITDCLLKLHGRENFYKIFYYRFTYPPDWKKEFLRPDFCVVWKNDTGYKIQFGEVEEEKSDWERYLLEKKNKYELLAQSEDVFNLWWRVWAEKLKLSLCKKEDFCFSVAIYSNKEFNLGEGFLWEKN